MKTAILVFGEFREFELSHKTWEFLNHIDYDLFISTWETSRELNPLMNIDLCEKVTPDRIIKYFPNATIFIGNGNELQSPTNKMIFHWRKLFNMVALSGVEYENTILIRTDIYIKEIKSINHLFSKLKNDRIYGLSKITSQEPPTFLFTQDCLFFGKTNILRESLLTFIPPDTSYKDIHYHLSKHFLNNDVYVESIHYDYYVYYVMRSVNRKFLNYDFETQKKISEEWYNSKKMNVKPELYYELLDRNLNINV
jgi:hypothetical protein